MSAEEQAAVTYLRSPLAVRARCENVLARGIGGGLEHFVVDLDRLADAADVVVSVTRATYPTLDIPVHGRMGHFRAGGVDRVATLKELLAAL
ncbi:MAG TPA: DUF1688 family protein, partial [Kofleriaceae bacterium]|nr:DUF1688 family protein [Kofleriaceae bacterium]